MKKKPIFWLIHQMRTRVPAILLLTFAQVANAFCNVLFALGSRSVIDSAVAGDPQEFYGACVYQGAIICGILVSLALMRHLRDRLHADLERDWKQRLLHGLLHGEYAQVQSYHSGELLNRLNNDVNKVNDGVLSIVPGVASMLTRLVVAVVILGTLDAGFTLMIALVGCLVIAATALMRRRLKELSKQVSAHDGKVSGFLQEIMEKLLMVQAMDVSTEVEHRADALLDSRYEIQRKRKNVSLWVNMGVNLLYFGAGFLALIWCAGRMLRGQMSFGSLTAVIQLVNQLQSPFVNLSGILPKYVAMIASAERLMELEQIQGEPEPIKEIGTELYGAMESIRAEKLSFSYGRDEILHNADFVIPKGAFVAVTGPSGIGKSTILKLLLGIFGLDAGELFVQCGDRKVPLNRSTRNLFAYVPQGNLLMSGTIRENLTIVKPDATPEEIYQAVTVSAMDEFLPDLPSGMETVLGESGAGLSEGQAQRLAIARAVLGGAPILLLDECTSALDAQTEQKVLQRLHDLQDRTCIAVTHRPAALGLCDWRIELQEGAVISQKMQ